MVYQVYPTHLTGLKVTWLVPNYKWKVHPGIHPNLDEKMGEN